MRAHSRTIAMTIVAALALAMAASAGLAAPLPSQTSCAAPADLGGQAVAAEREIVTSALVDFGLSQEDAASRVALLTDAEVHAIAADLDSIQTGGATAGQQWDTVTVLLLLILVAVLAD